MKIAILGGSSNAGNSFVDILNTHGISANLLQYNTLLKVPSTFKIYHDAASLFLDSDTIISFIPIWNFSDLLFHSKTFLHNIKTIICISSASLLVKRESSHAWERQYASKFSHAEARISEICSHASISVCFVRPTMIWGNACDKNVSTILSLVSSFGFILLPVSGTGYRYPLHVNQLANYLFSLLSTKYLPPSVVLLGPEQLTYREMCSRLFYWQNLSPVIVTVPRVMLKFFITIASFVTLRKDFNTASFNRLDESFNYNASAEFIVYADGFFFPLSDADLIVCSPLAIFLNRFLSLFRA
jgi:hypothetical protein